MRIKRIIFPLVLSLILISCSSREKHPNNTVIVGISSDIESISPVYSFSSDENNLADVMFLSLVTQDWDNENGELVFKPELAESWEWNNDTTSLKLVLKKDLFWSDGKPITIEDIIFSFDIYSDPAVQSVFYGSFDNFFTDGENHILIDKTFTITDKNTFTINFRKDLPADLLDIDMPVIPRHIYSNLERKNFITGEKEIIPPASGPFLFEKREFGQYIKLKRNDKSILYKDGNVNELIFKIVPEYSSRITQLKNGELNIIEDIKPDDVKELEQNAVINSIKGKEYDFIGLSNIDQKEYLKSGKIVPHKLFGAADIRKAVSLLINREEIIENFLLGFGEAAFGPVSPIFKNYLLPHTGDIYNPQTAKEILTANGWKDNDKNGILEKDGVEFSFTLYFPSGNPRREFASRLIQNNLASAGIEVKLEAVEPNTFFNARDSKKYDAWMAGWGIPVPLELKMLYYSDLKNYQFNFSNYMNPEVDKLLDLTAKAKADKKYLFKEIQKIFYKDYPQIYLYWIDNITACSPFLKGVTTGPLGIMHNCSKWNIE